MRRKYVVLASLCGLLLASAIVIAAYLVPNTRTSAAVTRTVPPKYLTQFPPLTGSPAAHPPPVTVLPATVVTVGTAVIPSGVPAPITGPPPTPNPNGAATVGLPAIAPHTQITDATTPTFTAQDASDYVHLHGVGSVKADVNGPTTVANVVFLPASALKTQLGLDIDLGLAPDRLMCVVQSKGSFSVAAPIGSARQFTLASDFFDAHTGNYMGVALSP